MNHLSLWLITVFLFGSMATPAAAYVGPGAGLSLLGALWGLVMAVVVALSFVVLWPFRRLFRKRQITETRQEDEDLHPQRASHSSHA